MSIYALLDCNNFYASCERLFNPSLNNRPIVVLSNNDGCIIARSNEAKVLGIPMGEPYYKAKHIIENNNVAVFSSNYTLYGDMSRRVMATVKGFIPDVEIYSIDEVFMDLTNYPKPEKLAIDIRQAVTQWTGIPVSIGIGKQ
jgi:DNA polymerase V